MIKVVLENLETGEQHEEDVDPSSLIYIGFTIVDGNFVCDIASIGTRVSDASSIPPSRPSRPVGQEERVAKKKLDAWQMTEKDPWEFL